MVVPRKYEIVIITDFIKMMKLLLSPLLCLYVYLSESLNFNNIIELIRFI